MKEKFFRILEVDDLKYEELAHEYTYAIVGINKYGCRPQVIEVIIGFCNEKDASEIASEYDDVRFIPSEEVAKWGNNRDTDMYVFGDYAQIMKQYKYSAIGIRGRKSKETLIGFTNSTEIHHQDTWGYYDWWLRDNTTGEERPLDTY